jgi:DNA processing protein
MWRRPLKETEEEEFAAPPEALPPEDQVARARAQLVESLSPTPVTVDELVRSHQLSPAVVWTVLLELELAGRLERQPGGRVALI